MKDDRIAYGAGCTWWDAIQKVGKHPSGLPCCPHCQGMLFEMPTEEAWWTQVDQHEANGHLGYRRFVEWVRGRCFADWAAAKHQFEIEDITKPL